MLCSCQAMDEISNDINKYTCVESVVNNTNLTSIHTEMNQINTDKINNSILDTPISKNEEPNEKLIFSIDLNDDGITEDFFLNKNVNDSFHVIMYDNTEKTLITDETYIGRTDKIYIYKMNDESGSEYYYAVYLNSYYKKFEVECLYTGNKNDRSFRLLTYGEDLDLPISCYAYNSRLSKEGFNNLLEDTKNFLYKYEGLEYVKTINLDNYLKNDYSEEYIKNISICEGMKEISIYSLKKDIFGKSFKFTNGIYSYYSNECNNFEIFKRLRQVWEYDCNGEAYITESSDDYDYLICLKASDSKNVELIYLGNKDESWLCSYYRYSDTSYAATQSGIDRDIEQFNSIMKDSISFLKNEGWEYAYTLEI